MASSELYAASLQLYVSTLQPCYGCDQPTTIPLTYHISPGMLDHFGGSNYSGKPSGIVTYSNGPWGGTRVESSK